jgi:hypothetical protein
VGAPCFSRGSWTSFQRRRFISWKWALAPDFFETAARARCAPTRSPQKKNAGTRLFEVVQEQLLLEIVRRVLGGMEMIPTFPGKLTQESFFIFPGKSGDNDGTGRS